MRDLSIVPRARFYNIARREAQQGERLATGVGPSPGKCIETPNAGLGPPRTSVGTEVKRTIELAQNREPHQPVEKPRAKASRKASNEAHEHCRKQTVCHEFESRCIWFGPSH